MEITTDADLLAFIPYAIDREPKNMLTLFLDIDGKHAVTAFQLPDTVDLALARSITSVIGSSGARSAVGVVFTDDQGFEDGHPPRIDISGLVIATFLSFLPEVDLAAMLTVGPDGWWNLEDPDAKHSLDEVTNSVLNAELIAKGMTYRRGGVVIPEPTAATMTGSLRIANLASAIPQDARGFEYTKGEKHYADARALLETLLGQDHGPSESQAQQMIAYFQHHGIRERLLGDIVSAPESVDKYALQIAGMGDVPFSMGRISAGLALLTNLLQYAEGEHRASVLATYCWVKWLTGDREYVTAYLEAAGALAPEHPMVTFLKERMRSNGMPPSATVRPVP